MAHISLRFPPMMRFDGPRPPWAGGGGPMGGPPGGSGPMSLMDMPRRPRMEGFDYPDMPYDEYEQNGGGPMPSQIQVRLVTFLPPIMSMKFHIFRA